MSIKISFEPGILSQLLSVVLQGDQRDMISGNRCQAGYDDFVFALPEYGLAYR